MKKPDIRELARRCGLSITTVSHALSGRGRVAASTAERVRTIARDIGFKPDPHAAILARRGYEAKAGVPVALLRVRQGKLVLPMSLTSQALKRLGAARGYHVTEVILDGPESLPQVCRALLHRGVQGVFIGAMPEGAVAAEVLEPFSVVTVGRQFGMPTHCSVFHDIFDTTRLALREMVARGYRRILPLLLSHEPEIADDQERWAAVEAERRVLGKRGPVLPPVMAPRDRLDACAEVRAARADGVLCFNDVEVYTLRAGGIRIPEDVGVAVLHVVDPGKVAGWWIEIDTVAAACLDLMTTLMRGRERGVPTVGLHVRVARVWREGRTLRPREA